MSLENQKKAIQNFADKFNLKVKYYIHNDRRKKNKFIFLKEGLIVSKPFNYNEANVFLLGVLNCKNHNI